MPGCLGMVIMATIRFSLGNMGGRGKGRAISGEIEIYWSNITHS